MSCFGVSVLWTHLPDCWLQIRAFEHNKTVLVASAGTVEHSGISNRTNLPQLAQAEWKRCLTHTHTLLLNERLRHALHTLNTHWAAVCLLTYMKTLQVFMPHATTCVSDSLILVVCSDYWSPNKRIWTLMLHLIFCIENILRFSRKWKIFFKTLRHLQLVWLVNIA